MTLPPSPPVDEERVLVCLGTGRDSQLTRNLLSGAGFRAEICGSIGALCEELGRGGAAALLAEQDLAPSSLRAISRVLDTQPPWSDFPIVVFSEGKSGDDPRADTSAALRSVTFLDRPVRVRSMIAVIRQALRSRRRQYEARRAIESRDKFLAMLGHELRNPLSTIRMAVEMEKRDAARPPATRTFEVIDRQSSHLARIVDDLLDVARITHGKITLRREPVNVVDLVQRAAAQLELSAPTHRVTFVAEAPAEACIVDADRSRIEQIVANLLSNAWKYTPEGGAIEAKVARRDERVEITVTDTGVGMSPELIARVFDPFSQADATLARSKGGLGLGLTVVRELATMHGGEVRAASAGPGCGSQLSVLLGASITSGSRELLPAAPAQVQPRRVVVVEDNEDGREMLVALLRVAGYEVTSARDGVAGLAEIRRAKAEIAFVDIGLPGIDGYELARRLRAENVSTKLVALSGYGLAEDRAAATAAGFDAHLTKPAALADMQRTIETLS
jgi:signal transduction histidine kinase